MQGMGIIFVGVGAALFVVGLWKVLPWELVVGPALVVAGLATFTYFQ